MDEDDKVQSCFHISINKNDFRISHDFLQSMLRCTVAFMQQSVFYHFNRSSCLSCTPCAMDDFYSNCGQLILHRKSEDYDKQFVETDYNYLYMCAARHNLRLVILAIITLLVTANPADFILGEQYEGQYVSSQPGPTFGYLQSNAGRMIAVFYGSPNRETLNSLDLFIMDPSYEDGRMVLLQVKGIIEVNESTGGWENSSHAVSYTTIWREREDQQYELSGCSSLITFQNLGSEDYEQVKITIQMSGDNYNISAELYYYDQIISTMSYSLFVSAVVALQIYCAFVLLRIMDAPNFVFSARISLLTLSLCNIEDFSQTMTHIQYIMGSESGYLFFICPALAYIVLFIIFDMKMLFLVWRSHNLRNMENPQILRKKLTAFYIQFYLGLFLYLTLTYFFTNDEWFILIRNLLLLPQIVHNTRLGSNPGFHLHYILGYIGTRLLLPLYERACPENRFRLSPNFELVVVLLSLYLLQVLVLLLQFKLGSRFFVPKRFLPNYYNYRRKLKLDDTNREDECAICLQNIFESEPSAMGGINESQVNEDLLTETTIMVTPCNHKFHAECLTHWMEVKLECPTCRALLPPM